MITVREEIYDIHGDSFERFLTYSKNTGRAAASSGIDSCKILVQTLVSPLIMGLNAKTSTNNASESFERLKLISSTFNIFFFHLKNDLTKVYFRG